MSSNAYNANFLFHGVYADTRVYLIGTINFTVAGTFETPLVQQLHRQRRRRHRRILLLPQEALYLN